MISRESPGPFATTRDEDGTSRIVWAPGPGMAQLIREERLPLDRHEGDRTAEGGCLPLGELDGRHPGRDRGTEPELPGGGCRMRKVRRRRAVRPGLACPRRRSRGRSAPSAFSNFVERELRNSAAIPIVLLTDRGIVPVPYRGLGKVPRFAGKPKVPPRLSGKAGEPATPKGAGDE